MLSNQALVFTSAGARGVGGSAGGLSQPNPAPGEKPLPIKHLVSHGHTALG